MYDINLNIIRVGTYIFYTDHNKHISIQHQNYMYIVVYDNLIPIKIFKLVNC